MAESTKPMVLTKSQQEDFDFVKNRIIELRESRKQHYGTNLDTLWAEADRDYIPHRLKTRTKRAVVVDEDKGWRGALVNLGSTDWQSDISQSNPFVKISIALSILVDQNPSGIFTAGSKKYQATTELIKQLYQRSWEYAASRQQLKLFVHNLAKYGWSCARTFPLRKTNRVKVIVEYNQEDPEKTIYEEKEVVEYNDIFRENLDPRNVWLDDMARPNNSFSVRDWCWRKVYSMDTAKREFEKYPRWKYVQEGGNTEEVVDQKITGRTIKEKKLVEAYFYESIEKDLYMVVLNNIPVVIEPLPVSDSVGNKKLSLWQTYWNIRHAESPYGIGIYEAIRYDQALLDRIRNMTIDQLTLSIYKMFFYQGTQALTETGDIKIIPGQGKQVLDPKNINWLEVPGPGREAWEGITLFKQDLDDSSGITDPLMGVVTGKTAFELAQAKESALKRLKNPLDNILDALEAEGYITISLIQLLYSIPETYSIVDPQLIDDYMKEIEGDPDLYGRGENGEFEAKVFPEFPMNLDKDEKGNLIETSETRFFRIKPRFLKWEGVIKIKAQSVLTPSKQIDKALDLEMYNVLIPLLAQPPEIYGKIAKSIIKLYDKDPRDVLPDIWLQEEIPQGAGQPLFIPAEVAAQEAEEQRTGTPLGRLPVDTNATAPAATATLPENPQGLVGKMISRLSSPFRSV